MVKYLPVNAGDTNSIPEWKDPLQEEMATHSSILAGKSRGQRSLVGYSPWGDKELDTTEHASLSHPILLSSLVTTGSFRPQEQAFGQPNESISHCL